MQEEYEIDSARNEQKSSKLGILLMLIPFFWGLMFIGGPLLMLGFDHQKEKTCTVEAQAYVVELISKKSTTHTTRNGHRRTHTTTVYAPVVSFTDENGIERTETSNSFSNPPVCEPGETVRILYDPNDPSNLYLPDREKSITGFLLPFIVIGAGAMGFSTFLIIKVIKAANRAKREQLM